MWQWAQNNNKKAKKLEQEKVQDEEEGKRMGEGGLGKAVQRQ